MFHYKAERLGGNWLSPTKTELVVPKVCVQVLNAVSGDSTSVEINAEMMHLQNYEGISYPIYTC